MHCPRCGQQQVSEEIKFCSRCGFPLGLIAEILMHGGFLPQLADLPKKKKWFTRKNGLKFSLLWFIFFTMFMTAIAGLTGAEEEIVGFFAVLGSLGGLLLMTISFLFLYKEPKYLLNENMAQPNQPAQFPHGQHQGALPPQSYQPVDNYTPPAGSWKAPATGDLVQPGSVTDATTKLLKKDE